MEQLVDAIRSSSRSTAGMRSSVQPWAKRRMSPSSSPGVLADAATSVDREGVGRHRLGVDHDLGAGCALRSAS